MKARTSKARFLRRLEESGRSLTRLSLIDGIEAMLGFYADERVAGCDLQNDGDMLLFQWGVYDWGEGLAFEVNVTRQLIETDDAEDEPRQLSLTFRFVASVSTGVGNGSKWCDSPKQLAGFRRFISESPAVAVVRQQSPLNVSLEFGRT